MMSRMPPDVTLLFAAFIVALGALGTAWIAQYGFGLFPCELCLYQRLPYIGVVALSVMALTPVVGTESRRLALQIISLLFLTTAGIAAFHIGVEQGWWESSCAPTGSQAFSLSDIRSALQQPGTPACDDVPFTFLGLSMAAYNMVAGLA